MGDRLRESPERGERGNVPAMTPRRLLSLWIALLVACGGTKAPSSTGPGAGAAPGQVATSADDTPLPLWPKVKKGTLANGLTYYILPHGKPENRVNLWLAVNAGSILEDESQRGLAHFLEHMAFNGTKRFKEQEIVHYLESIGMGFGADLNATTSFDETIYMLTVPADNAEYVSTALDILRDWASDVTLEPVEIEKERGVVLEEWRLGRGAFLRLFDKHSKALFNGSRYADRLPIGLPEVIRKAPREELVRFYRDWYRPDLMAVIAVGDIEPADIEAQIQAKFSDLQGPEKPRPRIRAEVPRADGTRVSVATDKELPTATITINNVFPHRPESTLRDFRRIIVEQIYAHIINERLATLARRQEAPFSVAQVGVEGLVREIDVFSRNALVKSGRVEDALRALLTEVLRVERHGVTQGELERARANLKRFYEQIAAGAETEEASDYTEEITRNFFEGEFMIGREAERDYTLKMLPTITLAELETLAKSFGGADNRVILISGPDGAPMPTEARVREIIAEVERDEIAPWEDKAAVTALMAQPPTPGTIVKEAEIDAIGVTEWTLSNGARVLVKPTSFEKQQVSLLGTSPGGLAVASDKLYPHARFADDLAAIGGVAELDDDSLSKVLTGKQVSATASIDETTETIEASAGTSDLETMFQLVHLRMTAPRKDEDAFLVWKENLGEQLANRLRVPEVKFALEAQEVLYKSHPRRKAPAPADIAKVDLDKALAFYADRFGDASDFTFVVVGDVELAKLRPLVETYLASLPARGRKEQEKDSGVRRAAGVVKKKWALGSEPKAQVTMVFHGDEPWSRDKERDLYVLSQVVGMRLHEVLREDLGGVYGVNASGGLSRRPRQERAFVIQFGCAPEAVDKLVDAAFDEIEMVARVGADPDDLEKIKQQWLRERETQLATNEFWVRWLASSARYGDDPTIVLETSPMSARMTSANVKAAAKRFLSRKPYFQAVLLPAAEK